MKRLDLAIVGLVGVLLLVLLATAAGFIRPQMSVAFCAALAAVATVRLIRRHRS